MVQSIFNSHIFSSTRAWAQSSSTKRLHMLMSKTMSKTLHRTINKVTKKTTAIRMGATVERRRRGGRHCTPRASSARVPGYSFYVGPRQCRRRVPRRQLFFFLKDRGFFYSCLRPRSKGAACRHFFAVMRVHSSPLRYHISLIPRRWFKDDFHFDLRLGLEDRAFIGYDM